MSCVARYRGEHDDNDESDDRRTHWAAPPFWRRRGRASETRLSFSRTLILSLLLERCEQIVTVGSWQGIEVEGEAMERAVSRMRAYLKHARCHSPAVLGLHRRRRRLRTDQLEVAVAPLELAWSQHQVPARRRLRLGACVPMSRPRAADVQARAHTLLRLSSRGASDRTPLTTHICRS